MEKPNFFTQSIKARVIEFILKRKRLSAETIEDFSYGIERALSDNVYTAAYPLHDVSFFDISTGFRFSKISVGVFRPYL